MAGFIIYMCVIFIILITLDVFLTTKLVKLEIKNDELEIKNIELVAIPINEKTPLPTLHWIVSDTNGKSIVIEKTKEGFKTYDNPIGVLTNSPIFGWHLTNLNEKKHK